MQYITHQELVDLYGPKVAFALLRVVELSAPAKSNVIHFDRNMRFQNALETLREERLAA